MAKDLEEIEFTIFDTETTGLEPEQGDRIVEIAAIRLKANQKIGIFQTLVNPGRVISAAAFAVNRITSEMLQGAPVMQTVLPEFLNFIQGTCLCSYNATFDLEFLNNELRLLGKAQLENIMVVDILKMAKRLLPHLERYALWFVAEKLGLKNKQEHRALSDVELTLSVFYKLKEALYAKGILDFMNFSNLFSLNSQFLNNINNRKIGKIQEAIDLGVKLKIKYLSTSHAEVTEREVIPKEIRQDKNYSYLVGYCCLRKEERTFRTDGILHLEVL